ncbi:MAG: hypothetical protein R3F13_10990 [Prosthecobacter sp.]
MKKILLFSFLLGLGISPAPAEDSLAEQLRKAAEKLKGEVAKVTEKTEIKGREWYKAARERLTTSREEYLQQAGAALAGWKADIDVLKEQGGRDYFKTRVKALEEHHAYAVKELETLSSVTDEAAFRARQKSTDKTMWTLEAAVEQAQEEAGL